MQRPVHAIDGLPARVHLLAMEWLKIRLVGVAVALAVTGGLLLLTTMYARKDWPKPPVQQQGEVVIDLKPGAPPPKIP